MNQFMCYGFKENLLVYYALISLVLAWLPTLVVVIRRAWLDTILLRELKTELKARGGGLTSSVIFNSLFAKGEFIKEGDVLGVSLLCKRYLHQTEKSKKLILLFSLASAFISGLSLLLLFMAIKYCNS